MRNPDIVILETLEHAGFSLDGWRAITAHGCTVSLRQASELWEVDITLPSGAVVSIDCAGQLTVKAVP